MPVQIDDSMISEIIRLKDTIRGSVNSVMDGSLTAGHLASDVSVLLDLLDTLANMVSGSQQAAASAPQPEQPTQAAAPQPEQPVQQPTPPPQPEQPAQEAAPATATQPEQVTPQPTEQSVYEQIPT